MRARARGPVERVAEGRSPWWGEHRSRYRFAQPFVRGARVLDVACGTGFGPAMLRAAGARSVVGVDLDAPTLLAARGRDASLTLAAADGTRLPFRDGAFDVVTSFETVEHVPAPERFLAELRRVTAAGGTLLLSTPNALVTTAYPRNPYHLREFTPEELTALLAAHFPRVELLGQTPSAEYRVVPFLPGREQPREPLDHVRLLAWKIGNRLPHALKDSLALAITRRHFFPSETDYSFAAGNLPRAHVQLALCRTAATAP